MGCEPGVVRGRPCAPPGCAESTNPSLSLAHHPPVVIARAEGGRMRFIGLDIHRDQCEVAIVEYGTVRSAGRFRSSVAEVQRFAEGLGGEDWVGLEATAGADAIARLIEPHVARVVIANTRRLQLIS